MANVKYNDCGYSALANAIITQAIDDYRVAIRGQWNEGKQTNEDVMAEVNKFLHSNYYSYLTKISGCFLLEQIHKEYKTTMKLINEGDKIKNLRLKQPFEYHCPICGSQANVTLYGRKLRTGEISYTKRYVCQRCNIDELRQVVYE